MEVSLSTAPSCNAVPLLCITGEIDHGNLFDLTIAAGNALREESTIILFDFAQVTYIDSGGLSVFYSMLRRMEGYGWLGIITPRPRILRMLEMIGLTEQTGFRIFDSLEAAEQAILGCPTARVAG